MVKKTEEQSGQVAKIRRSSSEAGYDYSMKFVLVGDSGTGKSAIIQRFRDGVFTGDVQPTIGVDFIEKNVTLPSGDKVKVQLWDTAGQERFKSIGPNYFRGAKGVFVVYDVMRQETADHVSEWLIQATEYADEEAKFVVLANKTDLEPEENQVCSGGRMRDMLFDKETYFNECYNVSAKTGEDVEQAIMYAVEGAVDIHKGLHEGGHAAYARLADESMEPKKSRCC